MRLALLLMSLLLACDSSDAQPAGPREVDDDPTGDDAPGDGDEMDAGKETRLDGGGVSTPRADASRVTETPKDGGAGPVSPPPADAGSAACTRCTGPGDWKAGDYPPQLKEQTYLEIKGVPGQQDLVRGYKVHVPPSYRPEQPMAVVFAVHGLGQNAVMFAVDGSAWPAKSDAEGFILIMPNGNANSWNGGVCCGESATRELDEVALFRAIFAEVGKHLNVDLTRVYATGLSTGAFISYRLACEAADIFTAIAPAAGAIGTPDIPSVRVGNNNMPTCKPSKPVSVLATHGTADPLVDYKGMKASLDLLAMSAGCKATTVKAAQPISAGDTSCVSYEGCPAGVVITGCSVQGGGHCWFGDESGSCGTGAPGIGNLFVGNDSDTMKNTDADWAFFKPLHRD